jgi:hypothetical protein
MQGRFDLEVSATADQRAPADQQLGEDRDRVGLGVRGDLPNDRSGQPVIGGIVGRRRPASGRRERDALRRAGRRLDPRLGRTLTTARDRGSTRDRPERTP